MCRSALWRVVYDNDYFPRGVPRTSTRPWVQPWTAAATGDGSGWDLGSNPASGRTFFPCRRFDPARAGIRATMETVAFNGGSRAWGRQHYTRVGV